MSIHKPEPLATSEVLRLLWPSVSASDITSTNKKDRRSTAIPLYGVDRLDSSKDSILNFLVPLVTTWQGEE